MVHFQSERVMFILVLVSDLSPLYCFPGRVTSLTWIYTGGPIDRNAVVNIVRPILALRTSIARTPASVWQSFCGFAIDQICVPQWPDVFQGTAYCGVGNWWASGQMGGSTWNNGRCACRVFNNPRVLPTEGTSVEFIVLPLLCGEAVTEEFVTETNRRTSVQMWGGTWALKRTQEWNSPGCCWTIARTFPTLCGGHLWPRTSDYTVKDIGEVLSEKLRMFDSIDLERYTNAGKNNV